MQYLPHSKTIRFFHIFSLALILGISASFSSPIHKNAPPTEMKEARFILKNSAESIETHFFTDVLFKRNPLHEIRIYFIDGVRFERSPLTAGQQPLRAGPVGKTFCGLELRSDHPFKLAAGDSIFVTSIQETTHGLFDSSKILAITYDVRHDHGTGRLRCVSGLGLSHEGLKIKNILYNLGNELQLAL